jgi:hypothetical protein
MSDRPLTDVLGPPEEWLITPEEIEQACAGLCEHLIAVYDCRPCLTVRLRTRQGQKIGARLGMNRAETDELVAAWLSLPPGARVGRE